MAADAAALLCTQCNIWPQSSHSRIRAGFCCNKCPNHGPWCISHTTQESGGAAIDALGDQGSPSGIAKRPAPGKVVIAASTGKVAKKRSSSRGHEEAASAQSQGAASSGDPGKTDAKDGKGEGDDVMPTESQSQAPRKAACKKGAFRKRVGAKRVGARSAGGELQKPETREAALLWRPRTRKRWKQPDTDTETLDIQAVQKKSLVVDAIKATHTIPVKTRAMLCTALQTSCALTSDFHPFQKRALLMVDKALRSTLDEKGHSVQEIRCSLAKAKQELETQQQAFDEMYTKAKAAVLVSCVNVGQKEAAFEKSVAAVSPSTAAFAKAEADLKHADHDMSIAAWDREQLCSRIELRQDIQQEQIQDRIETEGATAMEANNPVTDSVTDELFERLASRDGNITNRTRTRKMLALTFQVAKDRLQEVSKEQEACAQALSQAQSTHHERKAAVEAGLQFAQKQKSVVDDIFKDLQAAQNRLGRLESGPYAAFKDLILSMEAHHSIHILSKDLRTNSLTGLESGGA